MAKAISLLSCITIFVSLCVLSYSEQSTFDRQKLEIPQTWCVASQSATDDQLQAFIDFACGKIEACRYLQPGAVCYEPNTVRAHASFILDSYYAVFNVCDPTGVVTLTDPSYDPCYYPRRD